MLAIIKHRVSWIVARPCLSESRIRHNGAWFFKAQANKHSGQLRQKSIMQINKMMGNYSNLYGATLSTVIDEIGEICCFEPVKCGVVVGVTSVSVQILGSRSRMWKHVGSFFRNWENRFF